MYVILIRTIILYAIIVFGLRIMGKRQLGELQPSELVVTILISNIATLPIEDTDVPFIGGAIPILTLVCFEVFISSVTLKSKLARKIISGSPRIVIHDGTIDQKELRNLRFSVDDLMEQLRTNNVFDITHVMYAIVETTGKLSVYKKGTAQELTAKMMGIPSPDEAPPVVIVSDGKLNKESLAYCNLKEQWLEELLNNKKYKLKDIFLLTCNRQAQYYIVEKQRG